MAPKKQRGGGKGPSKSKGHTVDSKSAPKLQISAENERRLRRLLLNTERPPLDVTAADPSAVSSTSVTRAQKTRRIRGVYDKLSLEGFTSDQIEQALSALKEGATFEIALDWLCLNIPGNELPLKFSCGAVSSTIEQARSVRIVSTARADWVPTQRPIDELKEGTFGLSVRFKGQRDESSIDFGKSSQAVWIRQYLEQEEEKEDEDQEKEKEVDPCSRADSVAKEYRLARLGALEAKQKRNKMSQKKYNEIISQLKQELTSLGLSENDLESELHYEIASLKMQVMPSGSSENPLLESKPSDDAKFEGETVSASIVGSSRFKELNHIVGSSIHSVPDECEQKEELEELKLDNLFSEDCSYGETLPSEALKQQKEKFVHLEYSHILGNIDEIWKKGDPARIPKSVLQKFCQRLGWGAPKYNRVSAVENKFVYSVSILRTASGRGKSRKAGGLINFHYPNQDEGFRSPEEAQNKIATFVLYQLFPNLPFAHLLIEPYASFIIERLKEDEFLERVEDKENNRRVEFVDSLLDGVSKPRASKDVKDESISREMLADSPNKDGECNFLFENTKMTSLEGKLFFQSELFFNVIQLAQERS
ncbi:hypothetical protein KSP40_PGU019517 [Platanthera guangdongensis]|uniref:ATP-dependent RNA helicase DHX29-like UBA domain-containing protein n=1 Tax=Platanthera guangdongensis TaxID=2320717 RepID=A0ABR2MQI6_9ASPA